MAENRDTLHLDPATVEKIAKKGLPDGVGITAEARSALKRAAGAFVLYLTDISSKISKKNGRNVLEPTDVLEGVAQANLLEFLEPLQETLKQLEDLKKQRDDAAAEREADVGRKKQKNGSTEEKHDKKGFIKLREERRDPEEEQTPGDDWLRRREFIKKGPRKHKLKMAGARQDKDILNTEDQVIKEGFRRSTSEMAGAEQDKDILNIEDPVIEKGLNGFTESAANTFLLLMASLSQKESNIENEMIEKITSGREDEDVSVD